MKKIALLVGILSLALAGSSRASDHPRGTVLELHSCELYAGGCVVSSEEPLDGRYLLRAWNFTGGTFAGTDLAGLKVALLQTSPDNLAAEKTASDRAVVYLPLSASKAQREALAAWIKANLPDLKSAKLQTRMVPLEFAKSKTGYAFSAGAIVSVKTGSLEDCDFGGCGESLWYNPRTASTVFTVAVNRSCQVNEPLLKLTWKDGGKRSVFLARFGESEPAKNIYVTTADLCGPTQRLF